MQKVSKQSLAMLALSILLAISIALTFTFAALTAQQKTATGTITFNGTLAITMSGGAISADGSNYEITIEGVTTDATPITTALQNSNIGIIGPKAYIKVVASVDNGNSTDAVKITTATNESFTASGGNTQISNNLIAQGTNTTLASLFTVTFTPGNLVPNATGVIEDITITFTIDAQTAAFPTV